MASFSTFQELFKNYNPEELVDLIKSVQMTDKQKEILEAWSAESESFKRNVSLSAYELMYGRQVWGANTPSLESPSRDEPDSVVECIISNNVISHYRSSVSITKGACGDGSRLFAQLSTQDPTWSNLVQVCAEKFLPPYGTYRVYVGFLTVQPSGAVGTDFKTFISLAKPHNPRVKAYEFKLKLEDLNTPTFYNETLFDVDVPLKLEADYLLAALATLKIYIVNHLAGIKKPVAITHDEPVVVQQEEEPPAVDEVSETKVTDPYDWYPIQGMFIRHADVEDVWNIKHIKMHRTKSSIVMYMPTFNSVVWKRVQRILEPLDKELIVKVYCVLRTDTQDEAYDVVIMREVLDTPLHPYPNFTFTLTYNSSSEYVRLRHSDRLSFMSVERVRKLVAAIGLALSKARVVHHVINAEG